jgi:thymidylate synthase (FAD)
MEVKVIGVTQPKIEGLIHPGDLIAYAARVSNPSNQLNTLTASKLLKYLLKHKHFSPFEMINVVMEIETTRDIARQILRHRSFSFQEFSQRYADPTKDLGFVVREFRLQDSSNRQNSIDWDQHEKYCKETNSVADWQTWNILQLEWQARQKAIIDMIEENYKWAVYNNIAKEQARAILPEGLTISRMYMNGTLRSWLHYCNLRTGSETQKEHREVAQSCWVNILEIFPELNDIQLNA